MKHLDCVEENEEIQLVGDHTVKEIKKGASVKIVNGKLTVTGNILDNVTYPLHITG